MRNDSALDHPRIDDERIVDRYVAGRLAPEEEALFEEHLFACAGCLEQVEAGEELRRGLKAVVAEDAARATVAVGLLAWVKSRRPAQLAGLAMVALAFLLLPALLVRQQAELARLRGAGPVAAGLAEPTADLLVVSLGVVRDAGEAVEIRPDPGRETILLSLELPAVTAPSHRVTLFDASGEALWTGDDLEPNLYDTLLVAVPSSFLAPGSYRIAVEGLTGAGVELAGEIAFRILPGK